jgi:hypothetical protein
MFLLGLLIAHPSIFMFYHTRLFPSLDQNLNGSQSSSKLQPRDTHTGCHPSRGRSRVTPTADGAKVWRDPTALAATSFLPSLARQHCDLHCLLPDMGQHTGSGAASLAAHHLRWVSFLPPTFPVGPADSDNPNPNRPCLVF